jgi:uncharacterized protein with FMN-binding domain
VNSKGQPDESASSSKARRSRAKRSRHNLVALGSAAVLAVYAAGYLRTAAAAHRLAAATPSTAPKDTILKYKDGRYFGQGSCRHGDLQAAIVIKNGRIVAAAISECHTRYSKNVIRTLPDQVVARQSPEVDYISGATESSEAFSDALHEAFKKAE